MEILNSVTPFNFMLVLMSLEIAHVLHRQCDSSDVKFA